MTLLMGIVSGLANILQRLYNHHIQCRTHNEHVMNLMPLKSKINVFQKGSISGTNINIQNSTLLEKCISA